MQLKIIVSPRSRFSSRPTGVNNKDPIAFSNKHDLKLLENQQQTETCWHDVPDFPSKWNSEFTELLLEKLRRLVLELLRDLFGISRIRRQAAQEWLTAISFKAVEGEHVYLAGPATHALLCRSTGGVPA